VSHTSLAAIADRKALLAARAELDRVKITLAVHEIKGIVDPTPSGERMAAVRPAAAMLVGFAGPLLGMPRLARWLRFVSIALTTFRVIRGWRG
jgi:hypothetical protein